MQLDNWLGLVNDSSVIYLQNEPKKHWKYLRFDWVIINFLKCISIISTFTNIIYISILHQIKCSWQYGDCINENVVQKLIQTSQLCEFTGIYLLGHILGEDVSLPHWASLLQSASTTFGGDGRLQPQQIAYFSYLGQPATGPQKNGQNQFYWVQIYSYYIQS